jgi:hypothetical protein
MPNTPNNAALPNLVSIPKGYAPLNPQGMDLANLAAWHQHRIGQMGLLAVPPEGAVTQPLGMPANPAATSRRVWLDEPPGSIPFDEQAQSTLTGAVQPEKVLLSFRVPTGFDGVIKWLSNNVILTTGAFLAGDFTWSLKINKRPFRNFGTITQEKGTIAQGRQISPIRLFACDLVEFTFTEAVAGHAGQTVVSLTGYYYPSKGIS